MKLSRIRGTLYMQQVLIVASWRVLPNSVPQSPFMMIPTSPSTDTTMESINSRSTNFVMEGIFGMFCMMRWRASSSSFACFWISFPHLDDRQLQNIQILEGVGNDLLKSDSKVVEVFNPHDWTGVALESSPSVDSHSLISIKLTICLSASKSFSL